MKLNILDGIPVSFPAIQVIGLSLDLREAVLAGAAVVVEVVVEVVVVAGVVDVFFEEYPLMNFFKLNGLFSFPLCFACP